MADLVKDTTAGSATDSPEQARVVQAPSDDDALVMAGAGSGKTYTMTRRIITLIERGVAPERILGLTFTKKAASELLSRVSSAVLAHDGIERKENDSSSNRAFVKPEVLTYDAFFQSIVRQYGLLVGFDQNTQPLSEAGARQLATDVVERHMDLLSDRDFGAFSTVVGQVLGLSNAITGSMIGPGCATLSEAVERIRSWDVAMLRRIACDIGDEPIPVGSVNVKTDTVRHVKRESDAQYAEKLRRRREETVRQWHAKSLVMASDLRETIEQRETLLTLVEAYASEKRRMGMAEFGDFTVAAYQLVTRFASIGERYRRRYSHVLLDEYQDTSTTQAMLIATLFHPRSSRSRSAVTAVGDPFQSIYAWRGASPGAFRIFQNDFGMGEDSQPYSLSVTRRNSRIVLDAANNLTAPLRRDHRPRVRSSSTMREVEVDALSPMDNAPTGTLGVLGFDTLGQEIDAVSRFALASIKRHRSDGRNEDTSTPHVAVLFRSKATMPLFVEGLERAGLTTLTVGYSALLQRPEVRDVMALLHVVVDHTDAASLMRLVATPRFALSAEALSVLSGLAEDANVEFQFRSLVQAGLADARTPKSGHRDIVRQHRDEVTNGVFLTDVLSRPDLDALLERQHAIGDEDKQAAVRAGAAIRRVHEVMHQSLERVVHTAIEALDIDVDTVVAQAVNRGDGTVSATLAHSSMDSLLTLIDTYANEVFDGQRPSLRGFVSWVDGLSSIDDVSASVADTRADVVLMTIHQAKGLEWDSVAVVGMQRGAFPSNQGDALKVDLDEDHPGGMREGVWNPPEYHERAGTWLERPDAVPVPVRVDAAILPRFPHDARVNGSDDNWALDELDTVERLCAEVGGDDLHEFDRNNGIGNDRDGVEKLSQHEEYGRRMHADERRLAYVALTRAREDVLLTYHADGSLSRESTGGRTGVGKPSNFWQEVCDSLSSRSDVVHPDIGGAAAGEGSLAALGAALPVGFFAGERAHDYMNAVVLQAWEEPLQEDAAASPLPWPIEMTDRTRAMLRISARTVRDAMHRRSTTQDRQVEKVPDGGAGETSLLLSARMLVDDDYLMPWSLNGPVASHSIRDIVRARGTRILSHQRHNVTALQARAGVMNGRDEQAYWMGLVRPIPHIVSPAAQAGTRLHAWAERFINAFSGETDDMGRPIDDHGEWVMDGAHGETRASLLAELQAAEASITSDTDADEQRLLLWKRRLAESRWAKRRPVAAERQIVVALPQFDGQILVGKLDAIFYGGLDDGGQRGLRRYTIVDWKTGAKPHKEQDINGKLLQLDMYRLLLAAIEHVPLDSIDATLYYLNESVEDERELHARGKTEKEIVAELGSGIPQSSDDD